MAVVIETTLGDITVDLYLEQRPVTCLNFLKLCKMKYYNYNLFHTIRSGFIAQTGDPTGEGSGGESVFGILEGPEKRFFSGEKMPKIRHTDTGLLSMVCTGDAMVGSQFFFTLGPDLDSLDGVHCVIGEVTEGHDILRKLNDVICDETHRPYQDVRITHTVVLEDPFNDPPGFRAPSRSPSPSAERLKGGRIAPDEEIDETQGKSAAEIQEMIEEKEAKARATILEIVGDIPDADIAPPENVLFVCKLNPVTTDEDLEIIFSRFGKIVSCEVIRDKKTGDSLQYAFIEFADKKSCEDAYFKMDNVLIDDRRIHVDFSQSVSKIKWLGKGRGVRHINDDNGTKDYQTNREISKRPRSRDRDHSGRKDHKHKDKSTYSDTRNKIDEGRKYKERNHDRKQRGDNSSKKHGNHRERSRSRSNIRNSSRDKHSRHQENYNDHNDNGTNRRHHNSNKYENDDVTKSYSKSHKSKSSPVRNEKSETMRLDKNHKEKNENKSKEYIEKYKQNERKMDTHSNKKSNSRGRNRIELEKNKNKKAEGDSKEKIKNHNRHSDYKEPQTPPVDKKKKKADTKNPKKEKKSKKGSSIKKKRKHSSSSSDSDSSESSTSSSESSSSSESDEKRKKSRRKKKRYSSTSTSSSSSDSSSSSSSSDSSSETSSSSSDSEPNKKKRSKNHSRKRTLKKSKKKL